MFRNRFFQARFFDARYWAAQGSDTPAPVVTAEFAGFVANAGRLMTRG